MTKHYAYYGEVKNFFLTSRHVIVMKDGEEIAANPSIACDTCGAECWEESYLTKEEEDICPDCYASDKKMYAGAEHQKFGEPIPVVSKKAEREAPETNGVAKKSKADE